MKQLASTLTRLTLLTTLSSVSILVSWAFAAEMQRKIQWPSDYCVDITISSQENSLSTRHCVSGNSSYTDTDNILTIERPDLKRAWIVSKEALSYSETFLPPKHHPIRWFDSSREASRVLLSQELIGSVLADKFKVTLKKERGKKTKDIFYEWVDTSGLPIKRQSLKGDWVAEFKNFTSSVDVSLFEEPVSLQKIQPPSEIAKTLSKEKPTL